MHNGGGAILRPRPAKWWHRYNNSESVGWPRHRLSGHRWLNTPPRCIYRPNDSRCREDSTDLIKRNHLRPRDRRTIVASGLRPTTSGGTSLSMWTRGITCPVVDSSFFDVFLCVIKAKSTKGWQVWRKYDSRIRGHWMIWIEGVENLILK